MEDGTIAFKKSTLFVAVLVLAALAAGFVIGSSGKYTGSTLQPIDTRTPSNRVSVGADDDPFLGNENAPITIIEFSDFQCPFCRSFWSDTLPELEEAYVKTGKARIVFRDLPLPIHPGAGVAAEGAQCAHEQGKWREMHDVIFSKQAEQGFGTVSFDADDVKSWASSIGLNTAAFNTCLDSRKYRNEVQRDIADADSAGATGTPTFFVGSPSKGYIKLVGAQPFAAFKTLIDRELA